MKKGIVHLLGEMKRIELKLIIDSLILFLDLCLSMSCIEERQSDLFIEKRAEDSVAADKIKWDLEFPLSLISLLLLRGSE